MSVMCFLAEKEDDGRTMKRQSRQQRRFNRTRMKLLDAARSVFSEKGLDATTVDEITERADLGRGTFYYHFESKQDLIKDLIGDVMDGLIQEIEKNCDPELSLSEVLDGMIRAHTKFFGGRWEDFVLYYQGRADLTLEQSYEGIETPFMEYINTIEKLIDSTISAQIPKQILRRVAFAVGGFISGYYSLAGIGSDPEDVERSFEDLRRAFVAGLVRFVREAVPGSSNGTASA